MSTQHNDQGAPGWSLSSNGPRSTLSSARGKSQEIIPANLNLGSCTPFLSLHRIRREAILCLIYLHSTTLTASHSVCSAHHLRAGCHLQVYGEGDCPLSVSSAWLVAPAALGSSSLPVSSQGGLSRLLPGSLGNQINRNLERSP